MARLRDKCVFCHGILGRRSEAVWDRPLATAGDYVVVPSKGALVPGWLLVVATDHLLCAGALAGSAIETFSQALLLAKSLVEKRFGPATLFEHGPVSDGTALGCGVDHFHVHVVPLGFSLQAAYDELFPHCAWAPLNSWGGLRPIHSRRIPYVAVQEPGGELRWCRPPMGVRQPLRRAVAAGIGAGGDFDYALHPHAENVMRTVELLAPIG